MRDWRALVRERLGPLDVDPARAADIFDEHAQHVAQPYAELVAAGAPEETALRDALAPLAARANVARDIAVSDRPRPIAPPPPASSARSWLAGLRVDAQYAFRLLRRSPGFS